MSWASVPPADGRTLAYEQYGDPDGVPVLNRRGGVLCRLDVEPADDAARSLARIVSPDRPGVDRSDRHPGTGAGPGDPLAG